MTAGRLFTVLLRLYPEPFREEYGGEMLADFTDLHRARRLPPLAFWRFVIGDVVASAGREHVLAFREGRRRDLVRWLAVCLIGIAVTGTVATLFNWAYEYFYHPFLEGMTAPAYSAGFGACLGAGLGLTQSVALRYRLKRAIAWTLASAAGSAAGLYLIGSLDAVGQPLAPLASGVALGSIVALSQWMFVRTGSRCDGRSATATVIALAFTAVTFSAAIHSTFQGVNPLVIDPLVRPLIYRSAIAIVLVALVQPATWLAIAVAFVAMTVSVWIVGSLAPVAEGRHAH